MAITKTSPFGRRLSILLEAARLLSFSLDPKNILKNLVSLISRTISVEIVSIMLREDGEDLFTLKASRGLPRNISRNLSIPVGSGVAGWVAKSGKPLLIKDLRHDRRFSESVFSGQYRTSSLICLPLKMEGKVIGILSVNNKKDGTLFNEEDLELLSVIAEQASMALDKALFHQRVSEEKDRVARVNELTTSLITTLKPGLLKRKSLSAVCRLLKAGGASLLLYDEEHNVLRFDTAIGPGTASLKKLVIKPNQGLAGWVLTHGRSVLIRDARKDRRFWPNADSKTGQTTTSLIAVPLRSRSHVIGVLEVLNRRDGGAFTEMDRHFAEMIAAVVTLSLENTDHYQREVNFHRYLEFMVKKRTKELVGANQRMLGILKEMETLKQFNEKIVTNLASGLITFDEKGLITSINPPAFGILKKKARKGTLYLHQVIGKDFAASLLENIRTGLVPSIRQEFTLASKIGQSKILGYTLSRMKAPPRGYAQWILLFNDLTEVKKAEEDLVRLNRLVSLGEISAHVAHELRNPLTVMYASMQYLSKKVPPGQKKLTEVILDNMERMETITRRMFLLSREIPLKKQPVNLSELTSQSLLFLDKTFRERKITVSTHFPSKPVRVAGDLAQLQQALFNLLINASQAMEGGGTLDILLTRNQTQKNASLLIADSGPGIDPSLTNIIFDPFFTTKDSGTGLGLPIAHRVIQTHGGNIRARNRPGGGAIFIVSLPLLKT